MQPRVLKRPEPEAVQSTGSYGPAASSIRVDTSLLAGMAGSDSDMDSHDDGDCGVTQAFEDILNTPGPRRIPHPP